MAEDLLVEFEPRLVTLAIGVLEAEEPDLAQSDGLDHLIEKLLAGRVGLDGELQLRVDRGDADVHGFGHLAGGEGSGGGDGVSRDPERRKGSAGNLSGKSGKDKVFDGDFKGADDAEKIGAGCLP